MKKADCYEAYFAKRYFQSSNQYHMFLYDPSFLICPGCCRVDVSARKGSLFDFKLQRAPRSELVVLHRPLLHRSAQVVLVPGVALVLLVEVPHACADGRLVRLHRRQLRLEIRQS